MLFVAQMIDLVEACYCEGEVNIQATNVRSSFYMCHKLHKDEGDAMEEALRPHEVVHGIIATITFEIACRDTSFEGINQESSVGEEMRILQVFQFSVSINAADEWVDIDCARMDFGEQSRDVRNWMNSASGVARAVAEQVVLQHPPSRRSQAM